MILDSKLLIGETTAYDKKQMLEIKRPKSWLKSVSAFANGEGGILVFGISDDDHVLGLADAEGDAEKISEEIKNKLDPVPAVRLEFKETQRNEREEVGAIACISRTRDSVLLYRGQAASCFCPCRKRVCCCGSYSIKKSRSERCRQDIRQFAFKLQI